MGGSYLYIIVYVCVCVYIYNGIVRFWLIFGFGVIYRTNFRLDHVDVYRISKTFVIISKFYSKSYIS
jgi:hypothetical protein